MKKIFGSAFVVVWLGGCATTNQNDWIAGSQAVVKPEDVKLQNRDSQKIVNYFNKINPPKIKAAVPSIERTTIAQALAKYTPPEYRTFTATEIDTQIPITYDGSKPWVDALGKALADVNVELTVNLSKRIVFLRPLRTTIAEIVEKHVPPDYRVYADSNVNLDTFIRYDSSRAWYEALGKPLADAGIEMTTNVNAKLMLLRQIFIPDEEQDAEAKPQSPVKSVVRQPQDFDRYKQRTNK